MATTTHSDQAISQWHDTAAVYERLDALLKAPIRPIARERMTEILAYFDTKCAGSKRLTDEAAKFIPGGVQHNLAFNYPFPLAIERADGAHLWDVDGNRYIDFLQAGGPTVLGCNYAPGARQGDRAARAVRPGHRPVPRIRDSSSRS